MMVSRRGGNRIARDWLAPRTYINGARGGNRTHTALRPPDFESGASASSATRASDAEQRLARAAASLNRRIFWRDAPRMTCGKSAREQLMRGWVESAATNPCAQR